MKNPTRIWLMAGLMGAAALPVYADMHPEQAEEETNRWIIRGTFATVGTNTETPNDMILVDDGSSLGISATYMIDQHWGVEVLGALPFKHDIEADIGTILGLGANGTIASTRHLPPTVSVQYYPLGCKEDTKFNPYVGLGFNYTTFFDEKTKGDAAGLELSLDDSTGLAFQLGIDYAVTENISANFALYWIDLDTTADLRTASGDRVAKFNVELDPMVSTLGLAYRF